MLNEKRDVVGSCTKNWKHDRDNIQPVVEIFAKLAFFDSFHGVPVRCCQDPNIEFKFVRAAKPANAAVGQHAEQLWLQRHRHFGDFVETDFTADLEQFDVPTLVIQGDDDQIVPIDNSGRLTAQIVKGAELKVYPGASHGLFQTHKQEFNDDLLTFVKR